MANIKISELTAESQLNDEHIIITERKDATETNKCTLAVFKNWIVKSLINDSSTADTNVVWSASKVNSLIGDIQTILASVTGEIE